MNLMRNMKCNICPRKCNAERPLSHDNTISGYCQSALLPKIARAALHTGEEPCISGSNGSGTIFFSSCNLHCIFCQNHKISEGNIGKEISIERLSEIYFELWKCGAENINLVTPTHFTHAILNSFQHRPNLPFLYNTSGFEEVDTLKLFQNKIDIYMPDFKYSDPILAKKYSACEQYPVIVKKAILEMYRQQPKLVYSNGILKKGLIVRHMVLPGMLENSFGVIDWLCDNLPKKNFIFSLMSQYTPCKPNLPDSLNRTLTNEEYEIVCNYTKKAGFTNGYIQDLSSGKSIYTPDFDLTGV